jgi:hypothetical protein
MGTGTSESCSEEEGVEKKAVINKDDPAFIFTVGNASQVGERPGEHPYQPVLFDVETEDLRMVSIF